MKEQRNIIHGTSKGRRGEEEEEEKGVLALWLVNILRRFVKSDNTFVIFRYAAIVHSEIVCVIPPWTLVACLEYTRRTFGMGM